MAYKVKKWSFSRDRAAISPWDLACLFRAPTSQLNQHVGPVQVLEEKKVTWVRGSIKSS